MGRQSGDATTKVRSSIALLQERFRELEKVKERREEKELLKMLSLSESERITNSPSGNFDPTNSNLPIQPNMILPHRPTTTPTPYQDDQSLSLGLDLQSNQPDHLCAFRPQPLTPSHLWHNSAAAAASSSKSFDNSDIDTSLHL